MHSNHTRNDSRHQKTIDPADLQTQRLRDCLRDTLDNLLTSLSGDEAERDGAVEDVASVELCLYTLSLGRRLTELPFTFTSNIEMSKVIMGMEVKKYQETGTYHDAVRELYFFLHVQTHHPRNLDFAKNILQAVVRYPGQTAIARGQRTIDVLSILDQSDPEHRKLLDLHGLLRPHDQIAVERCVIYLLLHERQAFWTDVVDRMDDLTAASALARLTRGECNDKISGQFGNLLPMIEANSWDRLFIMGALRRRLFGPAKHWLHDIAARKPYLEFVVHEAVDFAVQTLRSPNPRAEEAVDAIKYAFRKIARSLMRLIPLRAPEFIEETPWTEQCRTVVRTAGLTSAHADVLAAALAAPRQYDRKEFARIFGAQFVVPTLSVLVTRTLSVDEVRRFLEQSVLGGGVPVAHDVLRETIKTNPAPDWPRSLQSGLLMRLALPPRNPPISKTKTPMIRVTTASSHAWLAAPAAMPAAPNARRPAAIGGRRPAQRPLPPVAPAARWLQRRSRACEMCLTM